MNAGVEIKRHADFVSLIVKQPRVVSELADLIGVKRQTVYVWIRAFEAEGLIRRAAEPRIRRNVVTTVWEWCA